VQLLDALILGVVQGITEFLPISSDGHLAIAQRLLGLSPDLAITVLLHAGTLAVVVVAFRRDLHSTLRGTLRLVTGPRGDPDARLALHVLVASIPTAAIGLLLRHPVERWTSSPGVVSLCLVATAVILLSTFRAKGERSIEFARALAIGVAQGLAVLPGLSRSGSTIAVALLLGVARPEAARFSFVASIPAVAGALALELPALRLGSADVVPALAGVLVAAASGAIALAVLLRVVRAGRIWAFAIYLVPLATFTYCFATYR